MQKPKPSGSIFTTLQRYSNPVTWKQLGDHARALQAAAAAAPRKAGAEETIKVWVFTSQRINRVLMNPSPT